MPCIVRVVRVIPILALFVLATSCSDFFVSNSTIQSVTVSPTSVLLQVGAVPADTYQLASTAYTVGGTNSTNTATANWTTSDSTKATVGTPATATTPAVGTPGLVTIPVTEITGGDTATITATNPPSGPSGSATVLTYSGVPPSTMNITPINLPNGVTSATIPLGTVFLAQADATLNGADKILNNVNVSYVQWTLTNNSTGATINVNGVVTVPATGTPGNFTINATAYLGNAAPQRSVNSTFVCTVI